MTPGPVTGEARDVASVAYDATKPLAPASQVNRYSEAPAVVSGSDNSLVRAFMLVSETDI